MSKLISFIIPSHRLDNIKGFLDNLEETLFDISCVEVLLKLDEGQEGVNEFIEEQIKTRKLDIRYIITPKLEGIFSVWIAVEQLFYMTSDSYFIQILSDEPRFKTKHWDNILKKYIGFFPDHVFRLRTSSLKLMNYASQYECTFRPDSFPIYTRRWLELTEGTGNCWGSDAFQQCVAFQLALGPGGYANLYRIDGLNRDIPIFDIEFYGLEFCVGVSDKEQKIRHKRNLKEWSRLASFGQQEHFSYLARRIFCYIWACENKIPHFKLVKKEISKVVLLKNDADEVLLETSYALSRFVVYSQFFYRFSIIRLSNTAFKIGKILVLCFQKKNKLDSQKYDRRVIRRKFINKLHKCRTIVFYPWNLLIYTVSKAVKKPTLIQYSGQRFFRRLLRQWHKNKKTVSWLQQTQEYQAAQQKILRSKQFEFESRHSAKQNEKELSEIN